VGVNLPGPPAVSRILPFQIDPQPDDVTCGPTCLQALYRFWGEDLELDDLREQIDTLAPVGEDGTLAVLLGLHALRRGYSVRLHSCNLRVFDPIWFRPGVDLRAKLAARRTSRRSEKQRFAIGAYLAFLEAGGELRMGDLDGNLIRGYLDNGRPLLCGLSATWLYQTSRENPRTNRDDDVHGDASGHFVVLCGYDADRNTVRVADPSQELVGEIGHLHDVPQERLLAAIHLGVMTYDGNLLSIRR